MRKSFSTSVERERRGRLVHDDQPRLHRERAGDLDHLLLGDARGRAPARIGSTSRPMRVGDGARLRRHPPPVDEEPRPGLAADEDVLGDRHVRGEGELLVDRDDAELLRVVRARRARPSRRRRRSCRCPAAAAPDRIFSSVDLPAPFSPSSAWISPGATSKSTSSSASTPGKRLLIPVMRSSGSVMTARLRHSASLIAARVPACGSTTAGAAPQPAASVTALLAPRRCARPRRGCPW